MTVRDPSEWIEVPDATPAIVDSEMFAAVQDLLDDPEQRRRGRRMYDYPLATYLQYLHCGRAMVGQTLQGQFRYYRCRAAFAGPKAERCSTVYVRADRLEATLRTRIADALADPVLLLHECERHYGHAHGGAAAGINRQIGRLDEQKRRLVKLYQLGEVDDSSFEAETRALRARRDALTAQLPSTADVPRRPTPEQLTAACRVVRAWIEESDATRLEVLAAALQLAVRVEQDGGEVEGVLPEGLPTDYAPPTIDTDVCTIVTQLADSSSGPASSDGIMPEM